MKRKSRGQQIDDVAALASALICAKNPWSDLIRDNRGYNAHEWKIAALFGRPIGHHYPDKHMEVWCQGIKVILLTKEEARKHGWKLHRVVQVCNGCKEMIPAGRMHQHLQRRNGQGDRMFCPRVKQ